MMYFVPFKNKVNVQLGVQYSSTVKDDIRQPSIQLKESLEYKGNHKLAVNHYD